MMRKIGIIVCAIVIYLVVTLIPAYMFNNDVETQLVAAWIFGCVLFIVAVCLWTDGVVLPV